MNYPIILARNLTKNHFCAFLAFGTPVFWHFEHKIGIFVRFWGLKPPFSGISSTKSGFLCSEDWESGIGNPKIGIGNTESGLPANHRAHL